MNQDQVLSMIRAALQIAGTFLVARGVFTDAAWATVTAEVITIASSVGVLVSLGWSLHAHSAQAKIASVAAMPEVKTIVTDMATADSAPSPKVVSR